MQLSITNNEMMQHQPLSTLPTAVKRKIQDANNNENEIAKRQTNLNEVNIITIITSIYLLTKTIFQIYYQSLLNIK